MTYSIEKEHTNTIIEIISNPQKPQISSYVHKNKITMCLLTQELPPKSGPLNHCAHYPVSRQRKLQNPAALEKFETNFCLISNAQLQLTPPLEKNDLDLFLDFTG